MVKTAMKVFLLVVFAFGVRQPNVSADGPVKWEPDFKAALQRAEKEDKWVLVSFYTQRCPYCVKMDREVFAKPGVAQLVSRLVPVKVNGDLEEEIVFKYRVDSYPTTLLLDAEGNILDIIMGYMPAQMFIARIKPAAEGRNPLDVLAEEAAKAPDSATMQTAVGYKFLQRQYYERARGYLKKGYELAQSDRDLREKGLRLVVASYLFEEDADGVIPWITEYHNQFSDSSFLAPMYFDLGRMNFERELYEEAVKNFTQAKELADDFMLRIRANWMLAEAKEKLGERQ